MEHTHKTPNEINSKTPSDEDILPSLIQSLYWGQQVPDGSSSMVLCEMNSPAPIVQDYVMEACQKVLTKIEFSTFCNVWKPCIEKGKMLTDMMVADNKVAGRMFEPPRPTAQSKFTNCRLLKSRGYAARHIEEKEDGGLEMWHCYYIPRRPCRSWLPRMCSFFLPTYNVSIKGYFEQVVNPTKGYIIANNNRTPENAHCPHNWMPQLRKWSDVAYLQYQYCAQKPKVPLSNLKLVYRSTIINSRTRAIIFSILRARNADLTAFPGITFKSDTLEGQALIGTPNGQGVAWLLIQHKRQLGHKVIDEISVYDENGGDPDPPNPTLLFRLKGVDNTPSHD